MRLAIVTTINITIGRRTVGIVCLPMCGCMTVLKKKIMVAGDRKREFKGEVSMNKSIIDIFRLRERLSDRSL